MLFVTRYEMMQGERSGVSPPSEMRATRWGEGRGVAVENVASW